MPGFILHQTAARILLDQLSKEHILNKNDTERNRFLVGNLLPDATKEKRISHFRNPECFGKMVEYPDLTLFLDKYQDKLDDFLVMGYYFHLYVDRRFFLEYLDSLVEYLNEDLKVTDELDRVAKVRLKRTGEILPFRLYFSDEYYYGDYTRMNTYLAGKYKIPLYLDTDIENKYITEASVKDVDELMAMLSKYMDVPEEEAWKTKVFPLKEVLDFFRKITGDFMKIIENGKYR